MTGERGSVLLLFPAALLVVLVLGAVAVDTSLVFLGQRQLANATAAAANDAAGAALADTSFYRRGAVSLDPLAARELATRQVQTAVANQRRLHDVTVEVDATGDRVRVHAEASVDHLFSAMVPGAARRTNVSATTTARAEESRSSGPGTSPAPATVP